MNRTRDIMDVRNLGEFAFAMSVMGLVLALIAFVTAFFSLHLMGIKGRFYLGLLSAVIWVLLNVSVYLSLKRRARLWIGEQRATKQMTYVEWCTVAMLVGLSLLAGETVGAHELIVILEYLFSFWILALLAYQVLLHFDFGYRICRRDAVRWSILCTYTVLNLYAKSS